MPIIDITNVSEYWHLHDQDLWVEKDFPVIYPPFKDFIFRYNAPSYMKEKGEVKKIHNSDGIKFSVSMGSLDLETEKEMNLAKEILLKIGILSGKQDLKIVIDVYFKLLHECKYLSSINYSNSEYGKLLSMFILIKKDGSMVNIGELGYIHFCYNDGYRLKLESRNIAIQTVMWQVASPCLLALSFMNCKNTKIKEVDPNLKLKPSVRRHMEKKQRPPIKKYYVLDIEPMKKVLKNEGLIEKNGLRKALHICRGHFKDYRNGNGLFGKFKGLYWWDSNIRGDSEYGEVVKDYNVKL